MAGETVRSKAVCLSISPWSRTSHIVTWLTPTGKVGTVVKGAVRPKSFFLGQYDLNYTCDILYYARTKGDLHALRDCVGISRRDALREDYRAMALAGYFRFLVSTFAPQGDETAAWFEFLEANLDSLSERRMSPDLTALVRFELKILHLMGLDPALEAESGFFSLRGERSIPISREVAEFLRKGAPEVENRQIPLDAARVICVFYQFHLDFASDVRRTVVGMICKT